MCWHQVGFQMFLEECILLAVVSAVGQHVSQSVPKVALLPAAFKSSYSPFVVIGRPELVIYGLFDCWHVKCSVPTPKAELGLAGSFVFSCLTFDLRTGASVKRHSFLGLASPELCGPRPPSETSENDFCQILVNSFFLRSARLIVSKRVCFLDACWDVSCFCLRLRHVVNPHLSPERHHPSCEKTLGIQDLAQRMKCCICENKTVSSGGVVPSCLPFAATCTQVGDLSQSQKNQPFVVIVDASYYFRAAIKRLFGLCYSCLYYKHACIITCEGMHDVYRPYHM